MSKEKPLTSSEMLDKATEIVNTMRHNKALSNTETIMILHMAVTLQVQQVVLDAK